jgi:hypothetical protein
VNKRDYLTMWPIILTATINPHPRAICCLNDPEQRKNQYKESLKLILRQIKEDQSVIFCENSNADLSEIRNLSKLYEKKGRTLIVQQVPEEYLLNFSGKGWGEGLILKRALESVTELANCKAFIKITGRYQILNLKRVLKIIERDACQNTRLKFVCSRFSDSMKPHVTTEFFWSDLNFYRQNLMHAYKRVNDEAGHFLEHAFAERLVELARDFGIGILPTPLIIRTILGWNARPALSNRKIFVERIKQWVLPLPTLLYFNSR